MTQTKREIEARGANIDEAVTKGIAKLGVRREDVIVDVVDEGSRGLLGLGARDAVVRLTAMVEVAPPPAPPAPEPKPAPQPEPEPEPKPAVVETAVAPAKPKPPAAAAENTEVSEDVVVAEAIVRQIVDLMGFEDVAITSEQGEPDDLTGESMAVININGDDLGVLIGPRGETLNAIQYLTRLISGNQLQRRAEFMVDVQGYRARREQALARLAERMAKKVAQRGRPMTLEPMPPNERRIIHMTLRDHESVGTNSVGEGKRRRVRIVPK